MPSYNGGGFFLFDWFKNLISAPFKLVIFLVAIIVIIIVIVIIIAETSKKSGFHESILDKPMYDRSNHLDHTCPLSNPDNTVPAPPSSDRQSNDIVGLALHRSNGNLNKLNQAKSLSSVNKSTKLNFGLNAYNELTTYE